MRVLRFALIAASLVASTAFASPADPQSGVEYVTLAQPQPTQTTGKKVEVIEFFMYHCPHCNALEPSFEQWVKKQGDNIVLKRIPLPFQGANDPEAHLYLTLDALGRLGDMHQRVFDAVHKQHIPLHEDRAIVDWVSKNGVDLKSFMSAWSSFGVLAKLHHLPQLVGDYKVDGVPTIVIDGKYETSPAIVANSVKTSNEAVVFPATLQVMDVLVARAAKSK